MASGEGFKLQVQGLKFPIFRGSSLRPSGLLHGSFSKACKECLYRLTWVHVGASPRVLECKSRHPKALNRLSCLL